MAEYGCHCTAVGKKTQKSPLYAGFRFPWISGNVHMAVRQGFELYVYYIDL